ncbi:MAG: geranylgeranylglycerol-phosphate geranylgeranyltransferase [Bacteroidales bacterium]|nr:geranylgeranylglycerol-phosphate geranylgeranyltransferase [Bacteroidales bacterium]
MNRVQAISRLVRLPNLIMVILTMYLMRWSIVIPLLDLLGFDPVMPEWSFALLVLSTILITAAGNVINDFHDVKADRINSPYRVVIDRFVSRRKAILSHFVLNLLGASIGVFIALYHWIPWLSVIFIIVPFILWIYSISLKHKPLIGNLVVSLLTGTVPLLVILFEYPLLIQKHAGIIVESPDLFRPLIMWVGLFSLFAFLSNLIRELVKDGEDIEGDSVAGSRTMAIILSISQLKWMVFVVALLTLVILALIFILFLPDQLSLAYFVFLLLIPFGVLLVRVLRVKVAADWKSISFIAKLIMLFGLLYAPVAYLLFKSLGNQL